MSLLKLTECCNYLAKYLLLLGFGLFSQLSHGAGQATPVGQDQPVVYIQPVEMDHGIGRYVYPLENGGTEEAQNHSTLSQPRSNLSVGSMEMWWLLLVGLLAISRKRFSELMS